MQRLRVIVATLVAAAACFAAGQAHALTCYILFDRTDAITYRGTFPPVDMSPEGDAQRDAMRAAGQFLMFVEADICPAVEYRFGDAGDKYLSIENIISDIRSMTVLRAGMPASAPAASPAMRR